MDPHPNEPGYVQARYPAAINELHQLTQNHVMAGACDRRPSDPSVRPHDLSGLCFRLLGTGPLEASPADETGSQRDEGVMEFGAAFPADGQALELVEQGEGVRHDAARENCFSLQRRMTMQRIPPGSRSYQLPRSK
jgi:hypothetical protein